MLQHNIQGSVERLARSTAAKHTCPSQTLYELYVFEIRRQNHAFLGSFELGGPDHSKGLKLCQTLRLGAPLPESLSYFIHATLLRKGCPTL